VNAIIFFSNYLVWHYTRAYRVLFATYMNGVWFITHVFSLPLLVTTFFVPWKRMQTAHRRFDIEDFAASIVFNGVSRVIGMLVRSVIMLTGIMVLLAYTVVYSCVIVIWPFMPLVCFGVSLWGITLLL